MLRLWFARKPRRLGAKRSCRERYIWKVGHPKVTLREITAETVRRVVELKVAPHQYDYVAENGLSISQAHFSDKAWFRAIYADEEIVGFIMLMDDIPNQDYFLWRLMVAEPHQGKGYGRKAVELLCDEVRTRPGGIRLTTSVRPGPHSPGPFYEKLGFTYTGTKFGEELELALDLDAGIA